MTTSRSTKPGTDRILQLAQGLFGYRSLRPGQREAVESVLRGRDTLVVMSTGAGLAFLSNSQQTFTQSCEL